MDFAPARRIGLRARFPQRARRDDPPASRRSPVPGSARDGDHEGKAELVAASPPLPRVPNQREHFQQASSLPVFFSIGAGTAVSGWGGGVLAASSSR